MAKKPLYHVLATAIQARANCSVNGNKEWFNKWDDQIKRVKNILPSGSGIDSGVEINLEKSNGEKIVLSLGYHHMNDDGYYDGWTQHVLTVQASLLHGFTLRISGRDRNQIKDYLHDVFHVALTQEIEQWEGI